MLKQGIVMLGLAVVVVVSGAFAALAQDQPSDGETQDGAVLSVVGCSRVYNIWGRPAVRGFLRESGVRPGDLMPGLRSGQSIEEAIVAAGGDADAALEAALAAATERLNEAVENGRITRERADELFGQIENRLNRALEAVPLERHIGACVGRGAIDVAANMTGLTRQEIRQQLRDGATLAEVLQAQGADSNAFIDTLVARAEARLNVLVVDGDITQAQADEYLAQIRAELTERISSTSPDGDSEV